MVVLPEGLAARARPLKELDLARSKSLQKPVGERLRGKAGEVLADDIVHKTNAPVCPAVRARYSSALKGAYRLTVFGFVRRSSNTSILSFARV